MRVGGGVRRLGGVWILGCPLPESRAQASMSHYWSFECLAEDTFRDMPRRKWDIPRSDGDMAAEVRETGRDPS